MLTIQQAAFEVLQKAGVPLKSIEIAKQAIEQQLIESQAKNPIQSISQALERNIRMNKGNTPKLEFVETYLGRQIQISQSYSAEKPLVVAPSQYRTNIEEKEEVTMTLPKSLVDKVKIFQLATGAKSIDEAISALLKSGLASNSEEMIEGLKRDMENL